MDFLVYMEVNAATGGDVLDKLLAKEAVRAKELARAGILRRLWRVPGRRANWGIWRAITAEELHDALTSLPLFPYMAITAHPLARHPNDPGLPLS